MIKKKVKIPHLTSISKIGNISILVLILGVVFTVAIGGLVTFAATQHTSGRRTESYQQALMIAEAGIQYYRWHLAHAPDDYTDGTGEPGPYVRDYNDPQGGVSGKFSLEIIPPSEGSTIVTINSTGWTDRNPSVKRTVNVLFGIPSLAQYSFLHNANVWFGSGITVYGRVMSNGGIRQDGVNASTFQSAKETYTCGSETGCWPPREKPGVWGSGGPSELWEFPVPAVDFDSISVDFNEMKSAAEDSGVYLGPSGSQGYHFNFKDDGTVDIYRVTRTGYRRGYAERRCQRLYQRIQNQSLIGSYNISDKKIFFVEDTVWVEGVVNGKAMLVAARFPLETNETNIWIRDNIVYLAKDGNHSLGLIAQHDIYFVLDLPNNFEINAALLAQKGKVIRHNYWRWGCGRYGNAVRDNLLLFGALISNEKSYWNFGSGPSSGFRTREVIYDGNLYLEPPPYFPTGGEYEFIFWDEIANP